MNEFPYAIGSEELPGLSKLLEEAGEVLQVGGKWIATGGRDEHWDGTNLRERMRDELADLAAAITFFAEENKLDGAAFRERAAAKLARFRAWHSMPTLPPAKGTEP